MKKFCTFYLAGFLLLFNTSLGLAQVRYGAKVGLNLANANYRVNPGFSTKNIATFQFGGVAELQLPRNTYLGLGLEVQGKGFQYDYETSLANYTTTINPIFVQVPVHLILKNAGGGVYGGIGPFLAYAVAGKVKVKAVSKTDGQEITVSDGIKFGNSEKANFRPFDYGLSFEFGYESRKGYRLTGGYSVGFGDSRTDIVRESKTISNYLQESGSLCFTYLFGDSNKSK